MFDRSAPKVLKTAPVHQLPAPPAVADSVDRMNFAEVFHNSVALPEG